MATVKLRIRKSKDDLKGGIIYYQIYHQRQTRQITTKMRVSLEDWERLRKVQMGGTPHPVLIQYKEKIDYDIRFLEHTIREWDRQMMSYTVSDVVDAYYRQSMEIHFLEYMEQVTAELLRKNKRGTGVNYRCAYHSFRQFLYGGDIPIGLFNNKLVQEYNDWLESRSVVKNSISFYMRILRAVYNRAVKDKLVEQTFPFAQVYTGIDRTRKLAVDEATLYKILALDLTHMPGLAFSRDLFFFSFSMRGMAFIDIAFLKKTNIRDKVLSYYRKKTSQLLVVQLEPCAEVIIRKYEEATRDSEYVFPILKPDIERDLYSQYHTALSYHNRKLRRLSKLAGLSVCLSSYTARHTWATLARDHNIPISVISAGMGHTSEITTTIYLASLQNSVIDKANHSLMENINKMISF